MTPNDFCYWLQGFIELNGPQKISKKQVEIIQDHLKLVFNKVTPDRIKTKAQDWLQPGIMMNDIKPFKFEGEIINIPNMVSC